MKILNEAWEYYQKILLPHTPEIQVQECKRAFYGGSNVVLNVLATSLKNNADEKKMVEILTSIDLEINQFLKDVGNGTE